MDTADQAEAPPAGHGQMVKAAAHVPQHQPAAEVKAGTAAKPAALKGAAAKVVVRRDAVARAALADPNQAEQGRRAVHGAPAAVAVAPVTPATQAAPHAVRR